MRTLDGLMLILPPKSAQATRELHRN
jgi:hypothetical protein